MLFKASSVLAAVLGFTLSQPGLGDEIKGSSAELAEKDGNCIFHFKDWPMPGCSGTQTKGRTGAQAKGPIGKVKDGKCVSDNDFGEILMYVDYCDSDKGAGISYGFDGGDAGKLVASNGTLVPVGLEIGNKAMWNGKKWDVTKK